MHTQVSQPSNQESLSLNTVPFSSIHSLEHLHSYKYIINTVPFTSIHSLEHLHSYKYIIINTVPFSSIHSLEHLHSYIVPFSSIHSLEHLHSYIHIYIYIKREVKNCNIKINKYIYMSIFLFLNSTSLFILQRNIIYVYYM